MPLMPETIDRPGYAWQVITHLGSAGLMLLIIAVVVLGLWQSAQRKALRVWLIALALAVLTTVSSKVLFFGWGIGIAALDFTGISGHALLATSVLPVFFGALIAPPSARGRLVGGLFGLALSIAVGISRVVLQAHSPSEVVAAWFLGLMVSGVTLATLEGQCRRPWFVSFSPWLLLLALNTTTATYLPTHDWEVRLALLLAGRDQSHQRQDLIRAQEI